MIILYILAAIVLFYVSVFIGVTLGSYLIMVHEYKTRGNNPNDKFKFSWFGSFQIALIVGFLWPFLVKQYFVYNFIKKSK